MSDITSEQFQKFIEQVREMAGLQKDTVEQLKKLATQENKKQKAATGPKAPASSGSSVVDGMTRAQARKQSQNDLKQRERIDAQQTRLSDRVTQRMDSLGEGLRTLDGDSRNLGRTFADVTKKVAGFAIIGSVLEHMIEVGSNWAQSFRDMSNVGQSFNGSVIEMAKQAREAGLPLDQFGQFVAKNSKIMALYGTRDVTQLAKKVRETTREVGNYGYSVEGMNELTASWLEMQRMQGNRWASVNATSTGAIESLANELTYLSGATGKSREEILESAKDLAQSSKLVGATMIDPSLKNNAMFTDTLAWIGSMGDDAKNMFTDAFSEAAINTGRIYESQTAQMLNTVGLAGPFIKQMQEYTRKVKEGSASQEDRIAIENDTAKMIRDNAKKIGLHEKENPELAALFNIAADIEARNSEAGQKNIENMKMMSEVTKQLTTIRDKLNILVGNFMAGLLDGVMSFDNTLKGLSEEGAFKAFGERIADMGKRMGVFLAKMVDWVSSKEFQDGVRVVIKTIIALGTVVSWVADKILGGMEVIHSFFSGIKGVSDGFAGLLTAMTTFAAFLGAKSLLSRLASGVSRMSVVAGSVFINGKGVGLGGDGGGADGRRRRSRPGRGRGSLWSRIKPRGAGGKLAGIAGLGFTVAMIADAVSSANETTDLNAPEHDIAKNTGDIADNTAESAALSKKQGSLMRDQIKAIHDGKAAGTESMSPEQRKAVADLVAGGANLRDATGKLLEIVNGAPVVIDPDAEPATAADPEVKKEPAPANQTKPQYEDDRFSAAGIVGSAAGLLAVGLLPGLMSGLVQKGIGGAYHNARSTKANTNYANAKWDRDSARTNLTQHNWEREKLLKKSLNATDPDAKARVRAEIAEWKREKIKAQKALSEAQEKLNKAEHTRAERRAARHAAKKPVGSLLARGGRSLGVAGSVANEGMQYIPGVGDNALTARNIARSGGRLAGAQVGMMGGAAAGAKFGAILGTPFSPAGMAVGAGIGGFFGGLGGGVAGYYMADELIGGEDDKRPKKKVKQEAGAKLTATQEMEKYRRMDKAKLREIAKTNTRAKMALEALEKGHTIGEPAPKATVANKSASKATVNDPAPKKAAAATAATAGTAAASASGVKEAKKKESNALSTPKDPARVEHTQMLQLNELRKSAALIETRLPPMVATTASLKLETQMTKYLRQLRDINESMLLNMKKNVKNTYAIALNTKDIKPPSV